MEFFEGKGAEQVISEYIEHEMSEYKKVSEQEILQGNIAPEAKEAFSRKPYYGSMAGTFSIKKPVIK